MNPMMMNNQNINQMDQKQILQLIQKNNEVIIQMIQQIFQIQMFNNMILNQILTNKLNNINNNNFNEMMNQMNNTLSNMRNNNDNDIDPWERNTAYRIGITFYWHGPINLAVPRNITVAELIEGFIKKFKVKKENIYFVFNAKKLQNKDYRKIEEIGLGDGVVIQVFEYGC